MAYSDKVLDHYEHPRNVGKMDARSSIAVTAYLPFAVSFIVFRLAFK